MSENIVSIELSGLLLIYHPVKALAGPTSLTPRVTLQTLHKDDQGYVGHVVS